jgi:hypothetical protein
MHGKTTIKTPKRCLTIPNRKGDVSKNEIMNYADACPLCRDSEGARQVFVSPDFSSSFLHVFFLGTRGSPTVPMDNGDENRYDSPPVQENVPLP